MTASAQAVKLASAGLVMKAYPLVTNRSSFTVWLFSLHPLASSVTVNTSPGFAAPTWAAVTPCGLFLFPVCAVRSEAFALALNWVEWASLAWLWALTALSAVPAGSAPTS